MENLENWTIRDSDGNIYEVILVNFDTNHETGGKTAIIHVKKLNANEPILRFRINIYPSHLDRHGADKEILYRLMRDEIEMALQIPGSDDFDVDEDEDGEFYIGDLY